MKSSLLKTVLATQLELYSAGNLVVNNRPEFEELDPNKDPDNFTTRPSEESFLVELDNVLFDELLDLEKKYPLTIHVIDNNTIIITPLPGSVCYNIPIVKSCRYLPAHVIFLVSDIMPFDIQLAFLEHIKCLGIGTDDTFMSYSTGIFNKYTKNFNDLPTDISALDSGFIRLPSMFKYTSDIISGIITGNSDHFVTRLRSTARNWNSTLLKLSSSDFDNPRNEFTVVVDGGKILNSITTVLILCSYLLDKDLTLNVIITRPSGYFTLNELVFDSLPGECPKYPKSITVNYFMFDFTMKIITDSNSTHSILYVRNNKTKNCLESEFKDIVKFNIYTSGTRPLDMRNVMRSTVVSPDRNKTIDVAALSFESYNRHKTGNTLYNANVPVADVCPLVNSVPDIYLEDNKHANFIYKRVIKKPLQE